MSLEVTIGDRTAKVNLIERQDNVLKIQVDDIEYDIDIIEVEKGVYSLIWNNKSFNVELIEGATSKKYKANMTYNSFDIEIVDAQSKYIKNRSKGTVENDDNRIFSPMPGKVVKILVKKGQKVKSGETVVVVEAMKMQSEYKVQKDRKVKQVHVKEGDTIDGNQTLITLA